MANQVIRITLKAYDHQLIDQSAKKIIETAKKTGAVYMACEGEAHSQQITASCHFVLNQDNDKLE